MKIGAAVYDVREAGGDRYESGYSRRRSQSDWNVDADGEVDQTLVVAPPQKAVAVAAGDAAPVLIFAGAPPHAVVL